MLNLIIYLKTMKFRVGKWIQLQVILCSLDIILSCSNRTFYPETKSDVDFSRMEKHTLNFWEENNIFQQSLESRPRSDRYVFYDGPPFANGRPHYGHLLTSYIKDTYARYHTMKGKRVERVLGWDCHGLPAEMEVEKEYNISGKTAIEAFGIAKFNKRCKDIVLTYTSAWKEYIVRQGRWVDFEKGYMTMTKNYMESVMWAFKQLHLRGLVYESERVMPYSWACQSPLSNFETRLDNSYRTKISKAVTVSFELLIKPTRLENLAPVCKVLVWTTTPWTLPSNLALAVGRNITYLVAWIQPPYGKHKQKHYLYVFSKSYLTKFTELALVKDIDFQNLGMELTGEDLLGLAYKPLFPYFKKTKNAFRILIGDHVTADEGTGIVHIAPGFGEEDFDLCRQENIPVVCPIDAAGRFTSKVKDFNGTLVFDANVEIIKYLKNKKSWFHSEKYQHNYPHCWRTDTPIIYRTMPSWYVAVTKLKARMAVLNQKVNWVPDHVKDGIFGNWINGAQDWSISRNRFWGTPIPVWKSDNPKFPRIDVYGSIAEIEKDFGKKVFDLHRPQIDNLVRPNPDDPTGSTTMRRVPDVFDCWFDSGSMPFAQYHYPFENKDVFEDNHPADFVTEYIAQTRGWFYTMFVLSTALFDKEPFKNSICHGVVLDTKGFKLSKRLNNYVDPSILFVKYGSDPLRFLMLSRPVVIGDNLLLDKQGKAVEEVLRLSIKPIWNSYNFFTLYANADCIKSNVTTDITQYQTTMDKYILLKCFRSVKCINDYMDQYNTQEACKVINDFFEALNNWYIRRTRERFWKSEHDKNKYDAYNALYTVLNFILRASAPLIPFITEEIWQGLKFDNTSVHLAKFPEVTVNISDPITIKMDFIRSICNAAMSLRKSKQIRVRQPLKCLIVHHELAESLLDEEFKRSIIEETNVKSITLERGFTNLAERQLHLQFSIIGKRIPDHVKKLIELVKEGKWKTIDGNRIKIGDEVESYIINPDEYTMKLKPKNSDTCLFDDGKGILQLDLVLNEELIHEGYARDVVRVIQETRKQADLHITDKIRVVLRVDKPEMRKAINSWKDFIRNQTLAVTLDVRNYIGEDLFSRKYDDIEVAIRLYHDLSKSHIK